MTYDDTPREDTNKTPWWQRAWAALIFFTRLPLWRVYQPPREAYTAVVEWWPLAGWITGGCMAVVVYLGSMVLPQTVAVVAAVLLRVLLTGGLHEDGLADFCDGFGGGRGDRERILAIMKDSHSGTYGILALVIHTLLLCACLTSLPAGVAAVTLFAADPYAKMLTAQLTQMMPYARNEQTSKAHIVYRRFPVAAGLWLFVLGVLPLAPLLWLYGSVVSWHGVVFVPCIVFYFLYLSIWRTLRGYTGDCCGAVCLITEMSFLLTVVVCFYR